MKPNDDDSRERLGVVERFLRRRPHQTRSRALVDAVMEAYNALLVAGELPERITLERLILRAGVGVGSFYEYFESKESFVGAFIGEINRRLFDALVREVERPLDGAVHDSLEAKIEHVAAAVAKAYLAHPARTRAVIDSIGRLGLIGFTSRERDRFAEQLLREIAPWFPAVSEAELRVTMRVVADAGYGAILGALYRDPPGPVEATSAVVRDLTLAWLERRHARS